MEKINGDQLKELFIEIKYNNNNIAFEKLYKRYNKLVYGIVFSILKNPHDTEDIVQSVFTKIYSMDKNKLPDRNEASWLYSTTKNETINYLKKKNNNIDLDSIYEIEDTNNEINKIIDRDSYNRLISKLNDTEKEIISLKNLSDLSFVEISKIIDRDSYNRLISKLNDIEKEIISLKILANFSFKEISRLLNMPTGTVKWKYYKSINTLKLLLSNLSMFVVTFLSSIFAFKNGKKLSNAMDAEEKQEIIENVNKGEEAVGNNKEEHKDKNEFVTDQETDKQENIIVENPVINNSPNYIGIGLMGLSSVFLIVTITFSIIFTKHQLNRRKKLSK